MQSLVLTQHSAQEAEKRRFDATFFVSVLGENELPPQVNDVSTKGEELFVSVDKSETVAYFVMCTMFAVLLSIFDACRCKVGG
jgi:hypothetical protein